MSNLSKAPADKVIPYCQDPLSSCGLFAYGKNTGSSIFASPVFFSGADGGDHKCSGKCGGKKCNCKNHEMFSSATWIESIFGGKEAENLADDHIGQMPDEVKGSGKKVSADNILSALETGAALIGVLGSKRELSEVEGTCGKQPKPLIGGKAKKQAWANCASAYMQSKLNANKKEGLSTNAIIGITTGSAILLGGILFLALRKRKPKVVMMQAPALAK